MVSESRIQRHDPNAPNRSSRCRAGNVKSSTVSLKGHWLTRTTGSKKTTGNKHTIKPRQQDRKPRTLALKNAVPPLIRKWEPLLGVKVNQFFVQRMKTKWGSCNSPAGNIRLNIELAKKPAECLEYIVVHEMTRLLEPTRNAIFRRLMEKAMPKWQYYREQLNRFPVSHEDWEY